VSAIHLQCLAAAFKICPVPTQQQLGALADRLEIPESQLQQWFEGRQALQRWVEAQPSVKTEQIAELFYQG